MRAVAILIESGNGPAMRQAAKRLQHEQGVALTLDLFTPPVMQTTADWQRLGAAVAQADFVFGSMIFGEEYTRPLEAILATATCPVAMIMCSPSLLKQTRLGKFDLRPKPADEAPGLFGQWLRAFKPKHGHGEAQRQIALVRGMSNMLKYLPGKARDLHSYIVLHQFWANSSVENLWRMLCLLIERYVPGYKGKLPILDALSYPDTALIHPDAPAPFADLADYQAWQRKRRLKLDKGCVGLLTLRALAFGGNTAHLHALVRTIEARGIEARLAYTAGLDGRPAAQAFFPKHIDLLVNTTGFALVGGPAATHPDQAQAVLEQLDVVDMTLIPLMFQHTDGWRADERGLNPMQLSMNVALPELDGAVDALVYGGPSAGGELLTPLPDEIELAAERIACRVALRRKPNAEKRLALVLFNFPPNLGHVGTAAYLDVFASVYRLLSELQRDGYRVDLPESVDALHQAVVEGNALVNGSDGNVADYLSVDDYRRLFPHYRDIEPYWGAAPGELLTDGRRFRILGCHFGNMFVGIQPSFGYERDPFRLLMVRDAAPHHGFAAFYTWLRTRFQADAVLHVGTHGALEFMPGKQVGLSASCWPNRLLGGLPNVYYYCVNNPSEGSYEYLGGLTKSIEKLRGERPATLMGEVAEFAGPGAGRVRPLEQLVRLESRAKLLNPKWFEGMLAHGYAGVREIEARVSNTYGWSATADAVDGWVYQGVAETYLLDPAMRERLAQLNPHAAEAMAGRLLEANSRGFWDTDEATIEQLKAIYADLEDRMEGVVATIVPGERADTPVGPTGGRAKATWS